MRDIQYKHQLQYTVLLQESAQALQAVVPDQETPITKTMHILTLKSTGNRKPIRFTTKISKFLDFDGET